MQPEDHPDDAIAVLGAGSWGTALAIQLARNGNRVRLWGHQPEHVAALRRDGENRAFLPGIPLPESIEPVADLAKAVAGLDCLLIVIPSKAYREFLQRIRPLIDTRTRVFWASKGFEIETGKFLHELVIEELDCDCYGVISGPTFATEVARGLPSSVTCAGNCPEATLAFARRLHGGHFRCYTSEDVIGV